jgi:hypothetical protein
MTERIEGVFFCLYEGRERKAEPRANRSLLERQAADAEARADEQALTPRQLLGETPDPASDETRDCDSTGAYRLCGWGTGFR